MLWLLSFALSEIAYFGRTGKAERAGDLTIAVDDLPLQIAGIDSFGWESTFENFARYDEIHGDSHVSPGMFTKLLNESRLRLHQVESQ